MAEQAFIDARCPECKSHVGWFGTIAERPPCGKCGYTIPAADLDHDQKQIEASRELFLELAEMRKANPQWERIRKLRVANGITLREAADKLGVTPTELSAIERGEFKPVEELQRRMTQLYGRE